MNADERRFLPDEFPPGESAFIRGQNAACARMGFAMMQNVRQFMVMQKPSGNSPKRNYKWPWLVGAAVVLAIALAIVWMDIAVKKVERERDVNAPLPSTAPTR